MFHSFLRAVLPIVPAHRHVSNRKGPALWQMLATSGRPMPALRPRRRRLRSAAGRPARPDGDARRGRRGSPLRHPRDPVHGRPPPAAAPPLGDLVRETRDRRPCRAPPAAPASTRAERQDAQELASLASFQRKQTAAQLAATAKAVAEGLDQALDAPPTSTCGAPPTRAPATSASSIRREGADHRPRRRRPLRGRRGRRRPLGHQRLPQRREARAGGSRRSRRLLHQRHLGPQWREPEHRQGARGRLRRVPRDHHLRHVPWRR